MNALRSFSSATRTWFEASFPSPTRAQAEGWPAITRGEHTLIHAPTGSGKTLAAFLWTLDRLLTDPVPERSERCRVLYVSPLKALAHDVDRNLRAPLAGIRHAAERLGGDPLPELTTFLRTGDTPQEDRRRMERNPPDILITTPESLYLMLTSAVRSVLRTVRWVIVDEVHAVAASKRGAHLALSLERLEEVSEASPQRIGLSATQRPLETIAGFLGGGTVTEGTWEPRPVTVIDVPQDRSLDIEIVVPVEDMSEPGEPDPLDPDNKSTRSIWPAVYPELLDQINSHNSTIVFANSRRLAERVCSEINNLAGADISRAHHGSVALEQRLEIEEALKRGDLKAVVATSSLELGIDMGAVDLVLQIEAPNSVASGLQRVGRSGHQVGGVSRAKIFPKYRGDLLVATVVAAQMAERKVESTRVPANPIDVLSQQLVAHTVAGETTADRLYEITRRAMPYSNLSRTVFDETLDMLSGRYPSDLFAELRPRLTWDRATGEVTARPGARQLAVTNPGTIPDRGLYRVTLPDGSRVGELDEEMVYESREGDTFLLGSSAWRINQITHDKVEVVPAPGVPAKMPFWHGDMLGRPLETGREVGRFIRETAALDPAAATERLRDDFGLNDHAAENLVAYLSEERESTGVLPTDQTVVVERFQDEIGDWRVVLLSPLGARIHAPWAMALRHRFRTRYGTDVDVIWSDDGIAFRFPDSDDPPTPDDLMLEPEEVESLLLEHLADTALFAARFREASGRALLLPRRRPGERTPLWLQRRRSADLLGVAKQFGTFPILLEVYREILQDDFDLPALQEVLGAIRSRKIRVVGVDTHSPSPFASSLLFSFIAAYMYEADTPLAERRAAALTLDRDLLRDLLGEGELRDLLDPEVVAAVELELQHLTDNRQVRNAGGVHDLLRDLGPLTIEDIEVRSRAVDVPSTLEDLVESRRAVSVTMGGGKRWAAIEDVARLRDGLGVQPPAGVPHTFLEPVEDPLGDVVGRYARTHGPFLASEAAAALSLPVGAVETALARLEQSSRVVQGAFRPGGQGREWVDDGVLKRLKRRSLSLLRAEIEPVEAKALARFEVLWQGVSADPPRGRNALHDAIRQLTAVPIPASTLERDVLAARVAGDPRAGIDELMLTGDLIWVGDGALGQRDGRVALYPRESLATFWTGPDPEHEPNEVESTILRGLESGGASFFHDIYEAAGGGDPEEVLDSLWDLVWSGHVTNDTFGPVRAHVARRKGRSGGRPSLSSRFPPHAQGRWSSTRALVRLAATDTERHAAWAQLLLDRHGVVTRRTVLAEGFPGGFSALYPVFSHLEETGRIRRGYFVEGLGGSQFALPGAVDRLRNEPPSGLAVIAATDPANPYGGVLPWPELDDARLARDAGAYVLLLDGELVGYLDKGRRGLTLIDATPERFGEISRALAEVADRYRRLTLVTVNGQPATASPLAASLGEWGFATAPRGLTYRG